MHTKQEIKETTRAIIQFTDSYTNSNKACKQVIKNQNLLRSLIALSLYKISTHIGLELDLQRLEVRLWSRQCLSWIRLYGDAKVQAELVNQGYGRVMSITFSTAGGIGEEKDNGIYQGLFRISEFLRELYNGRNNNQKPSFQPLPLLSRITEEQIEEEGANEEIDAQMTNKENQWNIKSFANCAKAATLNHFIHRLII
ncbi:MAG: hypothetical protein EZS28_018968 [Streblomastix strix]|uniref:Uncharacterized protein n=1 Tax=Streblomastix strix TaxID=222440 RepID=A0A5J4VSH3_9EUKA|nr:MAG: hypothetical protein EZS28_018968 [Streblomastix strix]